VLSWIHDRLELRRLVRWAEREAVALESSERVLLDLFGECSLIYLAESDHFVHEAHVMRRAVLPPLLRMGATAVLEELSAADGRVLQRFLESGDAGALDQVATFGDSSGLRSDRDDRLGGLLRDQGGRYPFAAMKSEHRWSLEALRPFPHDHIGIDLDAVPGAAYRELRLERVPGDSRASEMDRLRAWLAEHPSDLAIVEPLLDGLELVEASHRARSWAEVEAALARREEGMIRRAELALGRGHTRAVVVGHCGHLSRARGVVRLDDRAGPPPRALGVALAEGRRVGAIWMLHAEGTSSHPFADVPTRHGVRRGTVNAALAGVGEAFFLPIRGTEGERLLSTEQLLSWSFGARFRASLAAVADAVVFFRTVTPLRAS